MMKIVATTSFGTINIDSKAGDSTSYAYDKGSGVITYTGVNLQFLTGASAAVPGDVFVNPSAGTVKFSILPTAAPLTVTATVVPMSQRITQHSLINVQPQTMLDDQMDVPEEASSVGLSYNGTSLNTGVGRYVREGREWYIYRKTGTGTGNAAATTSTLYMDTRRLTIDLATLSGGNTVSMKMDANPNGSGIGTVMDNSNLTVTVGNTAATANAVNVTNRVNFDPTRARVYFPSYMEGLFAIVTYTNQNNTSVTTPAQLITWSDEPSVNAQNPQQIGVAERTVPILTAANESNPCLFMDPPFTNQGQISEGGGSYLVLPHRVWLFWSSARNAATSGSDVYYEALDPNFKPHIP
jgi:hypothetical protein